MRRTWIALLAVPAIGIALAAGLSTAATTATAAPAVRGASAVQGAPVAAGRTLLPASSLQPGASGASVRSLQRRLAALKYYPGPVDGRFGADLLEAVWAFEEVQGLPGHDYVTSAMWRALAHPRAPRVLVPGGGSMRVEVSLSSEVLVLYRNNQVALISHVSTGGHYYYCSNGGCGYAVTPTGNYRTTVYMPGWITVPLGEMYNPVFFIGTAFAIHGDTDVPLAPVSHGCVRIPMDIAAFFHTLVRTPGTPVYVRG